MGRKSGGAAIHPDRPCRETCELCDTVPSQGYFTHPVSIKDWDEVMGSVECPDNAWICWKCVQAIREGRWKPAATPQPTRPVCSAPGCEEPSLCKAADSSPLCNGHYRELSGHQQCGMCSTRVQQRRKCPNMSLMKRVLSEEYGVTISEDSVFCTGCYTAQLQMLKDSGRSISTAQTTSWRLWCPR